MILKGSFNKIIIIKNKVIKIENIDDQYSRNIMSTFSHNHKKYYDDLKQIGIKVAKLYFDKKIFGKSVEIQEYISGICLSSYIENKKNSINNKLAYYKKLLIIYKKTIPFDVALDLNMKNFIINKGELIYVDLIPSIYKSELSWENIENDEYKNYYLNKNLAISNVTNYFLRAIVYLPKEELKIILLKIKDIVKELFDFELDLLKNKKSKLLVEYICGSIEYEQYERQYQLVKRK